MRGTRVRPLPPTPPHLAIEVSGTRGDLAGEFRPDKNYDSPLHIYCFWAREDGSAFSESIHFLAEGKITGKLEVI